MATIYKTFNFTLANCQAVTLPVLVLQDLISTFPEPPLSEEVSSFLLPLMSEDPTTHSRVQLPLQEAGVRSVADLVCLFEDPELSDLKKHINTCISPSLRDNALGLKRWMKCMEAAKAVVQKEALKKGLLSSNPPPSSTMASEQVAEAMYHYSGDKDNLKEAYQQYFLNDHELKDSASVKSLPGTDALQIQCALPQCQKWIKIPPARTGDQVHPDLSGLRQHVLKHLNQASVAVGVKRPATPSIESYMQPKKQAVSVATCPLPPAGV